jgi:hypothetical protein
MYDTKRNNKVGSNSANKNSHSGSKNNDNSKDGSKKSDKNSQSNECIVSSKKSKAKIRGALTLRFGFKGKIWQRLVVVRSKLDLLDSVGGSVRAAMLLRPSTQVGFTLPVIKADTKFIVGLLNALNRRNSSKVCILIVFFQFALLTSYIYLKLYLREVVGGGGVRGAGVESVY